MVSRSPAGGAGCALGAVRPGQRRKYLKQAREPRFTRKWIRVGEGAPWRPRGGAASPGRPFLAEI